MSSNFVWGPDITQTSHMHCNYVAYIHNWIYNVAQ